MVVAAQQLGYQKGESCFLANPSRAVGHVPVRLHHKICRTLGKRRKARPCTIPWKLVSLSASSRHAWSPALGPSRQVLTARCCAAEERFSNKRGSLLPLAHGHARQDWWRSGPTISSVFLHVKCPNLRFRPKGLCLEVQR